MIAVAPWVSTECTQSFLAAAEAQVATQAFVFYHPDGGTDQPPPVSDPSWSLNDGGAWKSTNHYPIYAIPGATGFVIMQALNDSTGNLTNLANATSWATQFNPADYYASLYMEINTGEVS